MSFGKKVFFIILSIVTVVIFLLNDNKKYDDYSNEENKLVRQTRALAREMEKSPNNNYTEIRENAEYDVTLTKAKEMTNKDIINTIGDYVDFKDENEMLVVYTVVEYLNARYKVQTTDTKVDFYPTEGYGVILNIDGSDIYILVTEGDFVSYKVLPNL